MHCIALTHAAVNVFPQVKQLSPNERLPGNTPASCTTAKHVAVCSRDGPRLRDCDTLYRNEISSIVYQSVVTQARWLQQSFARPTFKLSKFANVAERQVWQGQISGFLDMVPQASNNSNYRRLIASACLPPKFLRLNGKEGNRIMRYY